MSLEQVVAANTAAIEALTAAVLKGGVPAAAPKAATEKPAAAPKDKPAAAAKPAAKAPEGIDYETVVKPKVIAFVKAHSREAIDALLEENFSVKSAKELKPDQYQALLDKIAEAEAAGGTDDVA